MSLLTEKIYGVFPLLQCLWIGWKRWMDVAVEEDFAVAGLEELSFMVVLLWIGFLYFFSSFSSKVTWMFTILSIMFLGLTFFIETSFFFMWHVGISLFFSACILFYELFSSPIPEPVGNRLVLCGVKKVRQATLQGYMGDSLQVNEYWDIIDTFHKDHVAIIPDKFFRVDVLRHLVINGYLYPSRIEFKENTCFVFLVEKKE